MKIRPTLPILNVAIALCLTALIGFTATAFAQDQQATAPPTSSEAHFRIISVRLAKVFPPPPNTFLKAEAGYVFVVVSFVPVPLKTTDDFVDMRGTSLVDSQGETHAAVTFLYTYKESVGIVPDHEELVFPMNEGAKPREMHLNDSVVDLTKTQQAQTKRPATQRAK
jgi:hypothetical protein